jgi:phosphomannomutase
MSEPKDLRAAARAWIEGDPDPETRAELAAILASGDEADLVERMATGLEFGTAGIRGPVGAGRNRMNRAVIIRTTRGLADHLASVGRGTGPVVVGFDGRADSRRFADDALGVLVGAGIPVRFFPDVAPTPVVAYAARRLGAAAAVVITASHNPPRDNGYKVYDANAAQIVPPVDAAIAAAIDRVGPACDVPRAEGVLDAGHGLAEPIGDGLVASYIEDVTGLLRGGERARTLRIAYTPLHGVGWATMQRAFTAAGFTDVHPVPEQRDPDGRFPTVAFPNPEEEGALDMVHALAEQVGADLVLANDPDADRLAVSVPVAGGWRPLTGNQIGQLMGDFLLERYAGSKQPLVVSSVVSSPMLASIAAAHGARYEPTLTGFKWIANAALDLERGGELEFVFGYEEALGYTVGTVVRDKDGIGAAVSFADLAEWCRAAGTSILERLALLSRRHGLWVSVQRSVVRPGSEGLAEIDEAMRLVRDERPESLAGFPVSDVVDYRDGAEARPRWLPAQALVVFDLGEAGRALVRPSGTEPKLKIYVDRSMRIPSEADVTDAEQAGRADAEAIAADVARYLGFV